MRVFQTQLLRNNSCHIAQEEASASRLFGILKKKHSMVDCMVSSEEEYQTFR